MVEHLSFTLSSVSTRADHSPELVVIPQDLGLRVAPDETLEDDIDTFLHFFLLGTFEFHVRSFVNPCDNEVRG